MYGKEQLLEELTLEDVETILTELGAQHFEHHLDKDHIITNTICHNVSDGKMKLYYYVEEKSFHCYTACSCSHSLFDLVISNFAAKGVEIRFNDAFRWILNILGKSNRLAKPKGFGRSEVVRRRPELDWMDNLKTEKPIIVPMKVYSEYMFELFSREPHPMFLRDNISVEAMEKFEISYYESSNRIVMPHRHWKTGELIGFKTRSLDFSDIDNGYKYIPLRIQDETYSYPTFQNLYGYALNKESIKKAQRVVVFEAEKSCLQFETYFPGNNFSVALCGSNISKPQIDMLISSGAKEICLALDKEYVKLNSDEFRKYHKKLKDMASKLLPYVNVSLIYDKRDLLDHKDSPSDKGRDIFIQLFKNREILKCG